MNILADIALLVAVLFPNFNPIWLNKLHESPDTQLICVPCTDKRMFQPVLVKTKPIAISQHFLIAWN